METFDKKMIGYVFHFMALHNFLYLLILFFFLQSKYYRITRNSNFDLQIHEIWSAFIGQQQPVFK